MAITIKKVSSKKELKTFIRFNYELYKENPYSVPDLYDDMLNTFSPKKNAAFEFCEAEYFLAYKDNKVVGRIAGIINKRANETWNKKEVRFGWIDFLDDIEISRALLDAVAQWGKSKGMDTIQGPLGFTDFDAEGMLVEGFDQLSTMATIYNYPYYPQHMEKLGFEKDAEMQRFVSGETQIMVATTVIEVGVNVPNASVMVIENAERFGLSQLHQLRGRVGRGADQSYCILVTTYKLTEETRKRLEIMVQTNDGFEIAEADLKLRGPGDLEGTQQSGVAFDLKIADIARDGQLLQYVRDVANRIVDEDPAGTRPENAILWQQLQALRKTNINWAAIS